MNSPVPASDPAPAPGRRAARAVRRGLLLVLLCVAVLGLGLQTPTGGGAVSRSFSDDARHSAREEARRLAGLAAALGRGQQAEALNAQAAALADPELRPLPLPTRADGGTAAADTADAADADDAAPGEYVRALADAARTNLEHAVRADGGTARLLASVGAGQWLLASQAAVDAGLPRPEAPDTWAPVAADTPSCTEPTQETAAGDGTGAGGGAGGDDAAEALQAAVDAEYGAAYAYEVVQARLEPWQPAAELAAMSRAHAGHGADGVELLPLVCHPALAPAPAYALDAGFASDPEAALEDLEQSLPGLYAELISLSEGQVRSWAIGRLVRTAEHAAADRGAEPLPGLPSGAGDLPWT
ncbi:hypothetical protein BN1051_00965 [Arthrobacter saudimassiliensis]|uniref:DUF4439 domain-containing protein n=1 Tax=Arthrobacter saudimassiliensis TaxID=1461584 RepID=A0A078MMY7_9MICC|nr:hypothetical protein BN1051_00965 [Arthrobacter saudimassiliensis]